MKRSRQALSAAMTKGRQWLAFRIRPGTRSVNSARKPAGWSLRRRLLLAVLGTSIGLLLVSLAVVVSVAWVATSEMFDDALEEGSRLVLQLAPQAERAAASTSGAREAREDTLGLRMYYQLVDADGRVLLRGDDTPQTAFVPEARRSTTTTVWIDDEFWRVHVRPGPDGLTAQVAQPLEERLELLEEMAESLAWPVPGLLLLLGLLVWFSIRRLLRPLEDTATRIDAKSPHDLAPVQAYNPPRELQLIIDALNALLARLGTALDSERRSRTAHPARRPAHARAAHRTRTATA